MTSKEQVIDFPAPPADARIPYGDGEHHFGDLRIPAGPGPYPVAIVIHGGYWRAMRDLEYIGHLAAALTNLGLATWNVEYRRIGHAGGGWPGTFEDVLAAAEHLTKLPYPFDMSCVGAVGHSAGGQLALCLAKRLPLVKKVITLGGVCDLRQAWEWNLGDGVVEQFLNCNIDLCREASPRELLPLGKHQIVIHGTEDDTVPFAMARDYVAAARAAGDDAQLVTVEGGDHFNVVLPRFAERVMLYFK